MPGRHSAAPRRKPWLRILVAPTLLVAAGGFLLSARVPLGSAAGCEELSVSVAAAPESVDLLERVAGELQQDGAEIDGSCVVYEVSSAAPHEVARSLDAATDDPPDLWVPDSSAWLDRVDRPSVESIVVARSMGRSPVVVAGRKLRRPPSWRSVLSRGDVTFVDPLKSSAPVVALLALRAELDARKSAKDLDRVMVPLAQRLGGDKDAARDLDELAEHTRGAAVLSEQQLLDLRSRGLGRDFDVFVPSSGTMVLDYPLVATSPTTPVIEAGQLLADYLDTPTGAELLRAAGFRAADLAPLPRDRGVGRVKPLPEPKKGAAATMLRRWSLLTVPSRILGVFDVSGSMDESAGRLTRVQLATQACLQGLAMFPDQSRIGLWAFASDLGHGRDYRSLAPVRRLDARSGGRSQRHRVRQALQRLPRLTDGSTGLYDTTLAAVRAARADYDPKAVNIVVLLTDGRNEDPGSISLPGLVRTLGEEEDPKRPVSVIAIGIGPDADAESLKRIVSATGGRSYVARNPRDLGQVFREAILSR